MCRRRERWSEEQVETLIHAVEKYGESWAVIRDKYRRHLGGRSDGQLKVRCPAPARAAARRAQAARARAVLCWASRVLAQPQLVGITRQATVGCD